MSDTDDEYDFTNAPRPDRETTGDKFDKLKEKVREQADVERALQQADKRVEELETKLRNLRDVEIPALCKRLKISDMTVEDISMVVEPELYGSLPKEEAERADAIKWLEDHGHGGIVKRFLKFELGKDQSALALRILNGVRAMADKLGITIPVTEKVDVHAGQLKKLVRELTGKGTAVPFKVLGVVQVHRSRLEIPGVKKRRAKKDQNPDMEF